MSDLEWLYVLLVAFYLWECVCWVRRGGVVLVRYWGRSASVAPLIGNQRGGFTLSQPLPPMGSMTIAAQLPFSPGADGVLAYVASAVNPAGRAQQTGRFVRWNEIQTIAARGKSIHVNGTLFALAQSTAHARWLARELGNLVKLAPPDQADAIQQWVRALFDTRTLRKRWAEFKIRVRPLGWLANVLLLFVFVCAPALVWRLGIASTWLLVIVGLFLLTGTLAFLFQRAHRAMYPKAADERFSQTLMVLLFSPAAMRVGDLLSRPLLEQFHPLAAASHLCGKAEFQAFARRILLDLHHPALPLATDGQPALAALEGAFRAQIRQQAEALVRRKGIDPKVLLRPPTPMEAVCRAYCPRCHAQFINLKSQCGECGGMPVVPFFISGPTPAA